MNKKKIANIPFGPYITVLAGATVNGKPNNTTIGAYGVVSQKPVLYISLKNSHCTTAGVLENGRPNALKVKPTVLMDSGYFDLNDRVG